MMTARRATGLLLVTWLMVGCQALLAPQTPVGARTWEQHLAALGRIDGWHLSGKVGYRQRNEGGSAWIDWVQQGDRYTITLSGPLGQGATVIRGDAQGAELESSEGLRRARTPEELLRDSSGLRLPVSHMLHWVRGMPVPDLPEQHTLTADNTLNALSQEGWEVRCSAYVEALDNRLPGKLQMQGQGLTLTLVIKRWDLPGEG